MTRWKCLPSCGRIAAYWTGFRRETRLGRYAFLARATITVRPGSLVIERGIAMFMRRQQMSSGDIRDITVRIGGQLNDQPYYEVSAARSTGGPLQLGGLMKDKADAECLAAAFKKSLVGKSS